MQIESIRALAARVAASHGLEIVDLEYAGGGGKYRTLRVFLERDAAGRAALLERLQTMNDEAAEEVEAEPGAVVLDMVAAGEAAGLSAEEDELGYLRELPEGVPLEQLSGITHGDCERFSRDFGTALDVEDLVPGTEYLLEVSSPGLDRKLNRREDFERFAGNLCKLQTFTPVEGNRHWQGRLRGVTGEQVELELLPQKSAKKGKKAAAAGSEGTVEIALTNVEKAQLIPEF